MSKGAYNYADDVEDVEEPFLGASTLVKKPISRSFSWIVTLLMHWTAIGILSFIVLGLYLQVKEINAETGMRVYCNSMTVLPLQIYD